MPENTRQYLSLAKRTLMPALGVLLAWSALISGSSASTPTRPPGFWTQLARDGFAPPAGETAASLASELIAMLASPDPVRRDEEAYETLAKWLHGATPPTEAVLQQLFSALSARLATTNDVIARSFAALTLKEVVGHDLKRRVLRAQDIDALAQLAAQKLAAEADRRGHTDAAGWVHALAHLADLSRILMRHPQLTAAQQTPLVAALIAQTESATAAWEWGEDARLANALYWATQRDDFNVAPLDAWLTRLAALRNQVWTGAFVPAQYRRLRAQASVLVQLRARVATTPVPQRLQASVTQMDKLIREVG